MEKIYAAFGKGLMVVAMGLAFAFPSTWFIMIALGILHDRWEQIPAFGYWETYVVFVALNMVGSAVKTGTKLAPTEAKK